MFESRTPAGDGLDMQALHYASGDMTPAETAAFEARLANDQPARDALVAATELLYPSEHQQPDPRYRDVVRLRLQARPRKGRPLLWLLTGAAAASVCFLLFDPDFGSSPAPTAPPIVVVATPIPAPQVTAAAQTFEAAFFADLSSVQRLTKVYNEETVRKRRSDERKLRPRTIDVLRPAVSMTQSPTM